MTQAPQQLRPRRHDARDGASDDGPLAMRAQADRQAFVSLYRRYVDPIYRFCHRRLGSKEDAEDATAQVFLKALDALPGYRGGSFRAWLFTIADRHTTDQLRSRRSTVPLDAAVDLPDPAASPEEAAVAAESADRLRRLLNALTPEQRRVVELRLSGLDGNEIAEVMGRSRNAVDAIQFRALNRLRRLGAGPARGASDG